MATLQIHDLPDPLHQMLQFRARQHHRSLSQQALSEARARSVLIGDRLSDLRAGG